MSHRSSPTTPILDFPFERAPEPAELIPVADGIFWIRMPMPLSLNHINLWSIEGERDWTLVDTGLANQNTIDLWRQIREQNPASGKRLARLIATHMHPDHIGLAGWLTTRNNAELWMSRTEYLYCHHMVSYTNTNAPDEALQFFRATGLNEEQLEIYAARFGAFGNYIRGLPHAYRRLVDEQELELGERKWRVIIGMGHSPEHVCLFCEELNLFISGDQLLPGISSNVSVWPTEPHSNPLGDWLQSCKKLLNLLPEDVLVLPAHGKPFRGAHQRLKQLIKGHEENFEKILVACRTPQRAIDLFSLLFKAKIDNNNLTLAAGETVAHLNYLIARGQVRFERDSNGVNIYGTC